VEATIERVRDVLQSGDFDGLLGMEEGLHFEAKGRVPYDLATAAGRYEIGKDVSALANAEGGWLVFGVGTEQSERERVDTVTALELVAEHEIDLNQLTGIIRAHVKPYPVGLDARWIPSTVDPELGLVAVEIPPQPIDTRPFIICKVVEGDEFLKEIVVGYCRRVGGDVLPFTPSEIRDAMRQGMNTVAQRLSALETKVDILLEATSQNTDDAQGSSTQVSSRDMLAERIRQILEH
jgi:predicted HTH transcriptional regulator